MTQGEIAPGTLVSRAEHVVSDQLSGAVVILDPVADSYLRLNPAGTRIWEVLAEPTAVETLAATLTSSFGIPNAQATADASAFVGELHGRGLVRLDEPSGRDS